MIFNMNLTSALPSRGAFLRWLRKTHGMIGLWGAVLGLLFGATGILLNHRHVMKLDYAQYEKTNFELALSDERPANAEALASWLQSQLILDRTPFKIVAESAQTIVWSGRQLQQPEKWKVDFHSPQFSITTEYFVGNSFVSVHRQDANSFAFLTRMHKGVGMNAGWILLTDSIAGALIFLSITGTLLWTKMRGSRLVLAGIMSVTATLAVLFTLQSI